MISEEHAALFSLREIADLPQAARDALQAHADHRLSRLRAAAAEPRHLNLEAATTASLAPLVEGDLEETREEIAELLKQEHQVRDSIDHVKALLGAVPSQASVAELIAQRDNARDALKLAQYEHARRESEIARQDRELETAREREARLLEVTAREHFEPEDVGRVLTHAAKVRSTLQSFKDAVVNRHAARIEGFVLDSFRQLIRKPTLVTGLRIDPATFNVELAGPQNRILTAERLSAGERQLLAIALLWGLARASGRPLPTVIDTPLGRLDSQHRSRLVSRYFPRASHQVMLLSTDEEITRSYYKALKPSVGRAYRLRYDDDERALSSSRVISPKRGSSDGHRTHPCLKTGPRTADPPQALHRHRALERHLPLGLLSLPGRVQRSPADQDSGDSNVEMSWRVFGGRHSDLYMALLKARCLKDGLTLDDDTLAQQFRLHLHRGIAYLANDREIRDIAALMAMAG